LSKPNFSKFMDSIQSGIFPSELGAHARSLWLDGKGKFDDAHAIVQDLEDAGAARIHAYLHRKEGDLANAGYWYRRAGCSMPTTQSLEDEWYALVRLHLA
jgi:hypothetical protein